jgi:uncharacterized protein (TIGR00251 family)
MTKLGIFIEFKVSPGATKNQILGRYGEKQIKISIKSPPVDGKANIALLKFIAEVFSVSRKDVELVSGGSSRAKKVFISGNAAELHACLERVLRTCKS